MKKRIAIALVALSGVASAQGSPFSFTVPFPEVTRLQAVLSSSGGFGNSLGVNQFASLDVPIGSRLVVTATSGVTFNGPGALHSFGQIDAMVDVLRFAGWHLAVSGGARRDYDGYDYGLARLSLSRTTDAWSVAANLAGARAFFSGPLYPNWTQKYGSFGATGRVASFISLGGETMVAESQSAFFFYFGPVAAFALPGGRARLDLSGGPNICITGTGNCGIVPNYSLIERFATPFPIHQSGYTLRLAVNVGL